MIYFDSAATSLQKPKTVGEAMGRALGHMATPGRGAHPSAMLAADTAFRCRTAAGALFGVENPEQVVFTFNATHGLNIAISSLVKPGGRVVISGFEHNSVSRPVFASGAEVTVAWSGLFDPEDAVAAFRRALPGASAAVCTQVSNVFGYILPIEEIAGLCRSFGVPLIIDASQGAGCLPLNFPALGADFLAMPGHKGLLGPQGTGILLCKEGVACLPILSGGTGSDSAAQNMPDFLPDRLEAGTHNITGIAGLLAGIRYLQENGPSKLLAHERALARRMAGALAGIGGFTIYQAEDPGLQTGVLSVCHERISCEDLAYLLGERGVAARAGLHCAPLAHKSAGTFETGTLRFSFSPFNRPQEVDAAAAILRQIVKNPRRAQT